LGLLKNIEMIGLAYETHRKIYFWALVLLAVSLPVSVFFMSLSQFILVGNWLLEGKFKEKINLLFKRKSILVFLFIFLAHIIWLINTVDYNYAFNDIRIKLPLLILPLIIGTSPLLKWKDLYLLMLFFCASVFVATCISLAVLLGLTGNEVLDYRNISIFISHIRFSLMINLALFFLVVILYKNNYYFSKKEQFLYFFLIVWFGVFIFILKSITGIIVLSIITVILLYILSTRIKSLTIKVFAYIIPVFALVLLLNKFYDVYNNYFVLKENYPEESYSLNGNRYYHNYDYLRAENGYYIWAYYCEPELINEWSKRSEIGIYDRDIYGNVLGETLVRYMASKGLKKDSVGVWSLTNDDINAIEQGVANYLYNKKYSITASIHKILRAFESLFYGDRLGGNTITQRYVYLKASKYIIANNFWLGVGTGDVQRSFDNYYNSHEKDFDKQWQLRAHNQFVTFFISFGLLGFLIVLFAMFYPIFYENKMKNSFFLIVLAITILSFLNEDSLETQAGVTFFCLFYILTLFGVDFKNTSEKTKFH